MSFSVRESHSMTFSPHSQASGSPVSGGSGSFSAYFPDTNRTKSLTCYFWAKSGNCIHSAEQCGYAHYNTGRVAEAPVQVQPGRPAVAGRNARRASPTYTNWDLVRRQRETIPANCAAQIQNLHVKFGKPASPTYGSQKGYAAGQNLFSVAAGPSASLVAHPNVPSPASKSGYAGLVVASASHLQNDPESTAAILSEQAQHLLHSQAVLADNCADALHALGIFARDYVRKEGAADTPLSAEERLRVAMGRILDVAEHHTVALEGLEMKKKALAERQ